MSALTKIFGTHSDRELKRITPLVDKVESYRDEMKALSDEELRGKTKEYKERLEKGETLDDLLPEAYATVREAASRVLGMEHYRVQIIGGIILHQGRIAEMKTGEGKTLVSTLPAYLNALEGKGVYIVTVNDYLAKRDSEWMGKVHEFLGLTVGVVLNDMSNDERRDAYNCDITYITNNELGFDYLRDNMVIYKEQLVQRGLHYAIIDEVDSVLIDEARTPLIISGQSGKSTKLYEACDILAQQLTRGEDVPEYSKMDAIMGIEQEETGDFIVNEKDKLVNLTQQGVEKVEKFFHIDNLADPENLEIQHNIILALRAHNLMHKDQDYVVKDDENDISAMLEHANLARKKISPSHLVPMGIYDVKESQKLGRDKALEMKMHKALEQGDFVPYLQPKYELEGESIAGAEALVRWIDPEEGMIYPDEFIDLFESNGFIVELDLYMFEEVCKLIERWHKAGRKIIPISVNLSRSHFEIPNFFDYYEYVLKKYDIPPRSIEIELTESLFYNDMKSLSVLVSQIHHAGLSCSIDDFGSGYSSLNMLKDVKVDALKLDRVFFESGDNDERGKDIIQSVIKLAQALDLHTISEGVEERKQVEFLKEMHCDLIQGYVFAKPMPVPEFEQLAFGTEAAD